MVVLVQVVLVQPQRPGMHDIYYYMTLFFRIFFSEFFSPNSGHSVTFIHLDLPLTS